MRNELKVEQWPIDRPILYARNPRNNDAAVDKVAASIKEFGFRQPIVVDGDGVIIVGHTRHKAARKLGLLTVPVHIADGLTPAQVKAYRLADNKVGEIAEWDMELLALEIEDLKLDAYTIEITGFDGAELGEFDAAEVDAPALKDGDRAPFRQATFTLHYEQWEEVEAAMRKAKEQGHGESAVNENSNGNALAFICQKYNRD